jgi:RNA polymerase-binding transcription factor DksA
MRMHPTDPAMKKSLPDPAALRVPKKWYRHYRKLQALREALLTDRAEQRAELVQPLEPHSMDDADSATDEFDHSLTLGILAHEEDALFEVDAAIARILDGTYGICEETGQPIPDARLRVVPWTRYTKKALENIERRNPENRPHLASVASIRGPAPGGLANAPEPEPDLISRESAIRKRRQRIIDLAGESGVEATANPSLEP